MSEEYEVQKILDVARDSKGIIRSVLVKWAPSDDTIWDDSWELFINLNDYAQKKVQENFK